jgi:alkyl hydroperoxide reductase subunit AhpC
MLVSHPADFTPVCTTELARLAQLAKPLEERNVKTVCLSVDSLSDHTEWLPDIKKVSGCEVPFPLIADEKGDIAAKLGLLDEAVDKRVTVRGVFIIDPEKKVRVCHQYLIFVCSWCPKNDDVRFMQIFHHL